MSKRPALFSIDKPEPLRFIIFGHGSRLPFMYTVATNVEGQTRLSQWFEAEGRTSLYFPNNIMSTRVGGCKLTTKTKAETIEKLCRNFAHFTAERTDDELSFIKHKAELYRKKLPMGSSKWGDNYAFVSASPSRRPRYQHNQCVPNMLLTAKSNQTSGLRAGLYMCTNSGLTSRGHFRTLEEIKGGAPASTLEAVSPDFSESCAMRARFYYAHPKSWQSYGRLCH